MKKKYIVFPILFLWIINFVSAFDQSTSWISKIEYQVKWCNPTFGCKTWYFSSLNTTVWPNYTNWFVISPSFKTICTNCTSNINNKDIFSNIRLKWEWVYTITIHSYDKVKYGAVRKCDWWYTSAYTDGTAPWNCSRLTLVYKIDKTHPNIVEPWNPNSSYPQVDESSKKVYVWRSEKATLVESKDTVANNDNPWSEKTIRWSITSIQDNPSTNTSIQRNKLKTIYYSSSDEQITINLNLANSFPQDTNFSYLSNLYKIEFLDEHHNVKKSFSLNTLKDENWSWSDTIQNIFWNNVNQKVFFFRVYDKAWNFSETPIYVVKDTKAPITLNEFLNTFTFGNWWEKIFNTTTQNWPSVDGSSSIPSKFFAANDNLGIKFSLSDKKNGNTNTKNSWLLQFKLMIEDSDNCRFDEYVFNPTDAWNQENDTTISQSWNINHNFSKVDSSCATQDSDKTYRYYKAYIVSVDNNWNEYKNKICDKVGNCTSIAPFTFRVVANKLSDNNSKIQVLTWNLPSWKMIANGKSYYGMLLTLKDKYWNKIVPVYSKEDDKLIKTSKLSLSFYNWLYLNQINKSWWYWTFKKDLENDTKNSFDWKLTGSFVMEENPQSSPNGVYKFKIYSIVPTSGLYPWISSNSYLQLNNINFLSQDVWWTDFTKNNDIWQFNENKFNWANINKIEANTWNLAYNDTVNRFLKVDTNNYGKLISNTLFTEKSFTDNAWKKIKFSFASPVLIWLYNIKNISEWVKNIYTYNLWNIDNSVISGGNFSFQEKWITNNPYNFTQWSGSNIKTWDNVEIIWKNFDNNVEDLPIIWNFNNNKQISKFTKISINPDLASFIDKNNNHIALWTKIAYKINNDKVVLPSDGRWIADAKVNTDITNKKYGDSISIFNPNNWLNISNSDTYDDTELKPFVKNIKILWLTSSNWNEKQTFKQDKDKHITIWWDIRKWKVKNNIRRKVEIMTRWFKWNDSCTAWSCDKYKYWNEYIVPVNWDLTFNDYKVNNNITYIVKWNVYISWNIYKWQKNALLSMVVLNPTWFNKKDLEFNSNLNSFKNNKGFVFIKSNVTNIDAYIFAEGSLLSYNWSKIFNGANTFDTDKNIFNQLYIRGWIISSNTIWASRLPDTDDKKCPWFVKSCNTNIAQAFDLIYLRRYMLTDASNYGWPNWKKVPYMPVSIAKDITSYNSNKPYMWWERYCTISDTSVDCNNDDNNKLKNIPDNDMEYPLYIEFDPTIKLNMPEVFKP